MRSVRKAIRAPSGDQTGVPFSPGPGRQPRLRAARHVADPDLVLVDPRVVQRERDPRAVGRDPREAVPAGLPEGGQEFPGAVEPLEPRREKRAVVDEHAVRGHREAREVEEPEVPADRLRHGLRIAADFETLRVERLRQQASARDASPHVEQIPLRVDRVGGKRHQGLGGRSVERADVEPVGLVLRAAGEVQSREEKVPSVGEEGRVAMARLVAGFVELRDRNRLAAPGRETVDRTRGLGEEQVAAGTPGAADAVES